MVVFLSLELAYKSPCFNFNFINKFPFSDKRHLLDFCLWSQLYLFVTRKNAFKNLKFLKRATKILLMQSMIDLKLADL